MVITEKGKLVVGITINHVHFHCYNVHDYIFESSSEYESACMCLCSVLSPYLKAQWVEAGVRPAANWSVSLNLHGIQQVLVTEAGGPADLELRLLNAAGARVMELETKTRNREGKEKKKTAESCQFCALFCLISGSQVTEAIIRLS